MSDTIEVSAGPQPVSKAALLKAYLDELNVDLHVQQLYEDGVFCGQQIRVTDRKPVIEQAVSPVRLDGGGRSA